MKTLKIAKNLSLPLETVTQAIAILAKRRAGKSFTMRRIVEQLFAADQQVVIVDPKGDQWGIRSAADGRGPGLPIIILGGEHGDVPLESGSGELVAKLVVEERVSILLDISHFRKHEVATFMAAFLENIYRLKAQERYRTPLSLVIDESDAIAPQHPQKGEERMLGAAEDIVRRGGQRGIGCILVTQRSAVLNKNVLTQCQMIVALRTIAPQDLKAMDAWIQVHGEPEQRKILMESLPSLPVGDAWFWSPGWPTNEGIFKRVHVLPIETFDSGATPKPGEKPVNPKHVADIDLNALKRQMAATIEKAQADNPRALRKKIAEQNILIAELQRQPKCVPAAKPKTIEVSVLKKKDVADIQQAARELQKAHIKIESIHKAWRENLQLIGGRINKLLATMTDAKSFNSEGPAAVKHAVKSIPDSVLYPVAKTIYDQASREGNNGLSAYALGLINTMARRHPMQVTRGQLAVLSGRSIRSSAFSAAFVEIQRAGMVRHNGSLYLLTDLGLEAGGAADHSPQSPREKQDTWKQALPTYERSLFEVLLSVYPEGLTREELAARAGKSIKSSAFSGAVVSLRKNGLSDDFGGKIKASEILF